MQYKNKHLPAVSVHQYKRESGIIHKWLLGRKWLHFSEAVLWPSGVCGLEGVSVQRLCLPSLLHALTANKPTGIAGGHEACVMALRPKTRFCHSPYRSAHQIASPSTGTGFMAVWSAEMHVWLCSRLDKPLQGGPCSYYDLRGIAITASALRQNERTTHSTEACARAPVRNRPIKCVQWTSAPHRRAICLVVPISCCVDTLVADSPIPTVTESPGSHSGKRETAWALVISHCHFAWNGNLLQEKKDEIFL